MPRILNKLLDDDNAVALCSERGVEYEFRVAAKNVVDYGEAAVETIRTPDGSKPESITDHSGLYYGTICQTILYPVISLV